MNALNRLLFLLLLSKLYLSLIGYFRRISPLLETHTTTTREDTTEDTGVLSETVNVIGEVISLPFRAVGGLVRAIF